MTELAIAGLIILSVVLLVHEQWLMLRTVHARKDRGLPIEDHDSGFTSE